MTSKIITGGFPHTRLRRTRAQEWSRRLVRETQLTTDNLIWPLFVIEGQGKRQPVGTMPGVERLSLDQVLRAAEEAARLEIPVLALFPCIEASLKDDKGTQAVNPDNLVCRTVRALKERFPQLGVLCDVALDPYTSHGHDGILKGSTIENDETLEILAQQSVVQAQAGCDIIAPSDMMDGRVGVIREALDKEQLPHVMIMAYAAKYASAFYGPFRDAVNSKGLLKGDKKTYQMDPANSNEALREVALDIEEGADMVMVKPGMPYLDIVYRVKEQFKVPTFVYQVSGEYASLKIAGEQGALNFETALMESLFAMRRAGADGILTYAAREAAELLKKR